MACPLFDAKSLSEPMLPYCQLDPDEDNSVKFYLKFESFHFKELCLKMSSAKWRPFYLNLNVLTQWGLMRHTGFYMAHNVHKRCTN